MSSTFFGLETARTALMANQIAQNTVSHNIANASTKGYSRQEAIMTATRPFMTPGLNSPTNAGQIGTGVSIEQIRRIRDSFIDVQFRKENRELGEWETKQKSLEQMELIYNEPTDQAIRANIDEFWQSLQDLSVKPELEPVRTTVRQKAMTLTSNMNQIYSQLHELKKDNDAELETLVTDINSTVRQISELNKEIVRVESSGNLANDYRDRRDLLLDNLSKMVGIQFEEDTLGAMHVFVRGKELVSATTCQQFEIKLDTTIDPSMPISRVTWSDTKDEVYATGGILKGLINVRDEIIPSFMKQLDDVASTLANQINVIHRGGLGLDGQTGMAFFASSDNSHLSSRKKITTGTGDNSDPLNQQFKDIGATIEFTINGKDYSFDTTTTTLNQVVAAINADFPGMASYDSTTDKFSLDQTALTAPEKDVVYADKTGSFLRTHLQVYISAKDIAVSQNIQASLRNIAAAPKPAGWVNGTPPASGEGGNALAMADMKHTKVGIGTAVTTINDYFNSNMSQLGVLSLEASSKMENKEILLEGLETRRQSVCGVNPDEEMSNMIKYQHGYSAASTMVTTLKDMLDTLINMVR